MRRSRTTDSRLQSARSARASWNHQHVASARVVPLTPAGRVSMATQTDTEVQYLPQLPNEKGTMTAGDSMDSHYATALEMSNNPYNNFYQRMMKTGGGGGGFAQAARPAPTLAPSRRPVSPPVLRMGNMGSSWRHVTQCTGALGNHICFVDGEVKNADVKHYPPYGYVTEPPPQDPYMAPRPARLQSAPMRRPLDHPHPQTKSMENMSGYESNSGMVRSISPKRSTSYNRNARRGFRYWYDEKPPGRPAVPARTIMGNMMKLGVGY